MKWWELNRNLKDALLEGREYNPYAIAPGTGHWEFVTCIKELHE
jgi:hypothetical protein